MSNRRQRGQSLVETGIALPVLLLLACGIFDLGRGWYAHVTTVGSASAIARVVMANYGGHGPDDTTVCNAAKADLQNATSVTCVFVNHLPPYVAGTDYATPAPGSAVVLVFPGWQSSPCDTSHPCRDWTGNPLHAQIAVEVHYTFPLYTPLMQQLVPSDAINMADQAQEVSNW